MRFAVEAWAPEYGLPADPDHLEDPSGAVDLGVELAAGQWSPITPAGAAEPPGCVVFVDGVQRIDARIWITDGDRTRPGVCASVAAGAVRCEGSAARIADPRVFRGVYAAVSDTAGPIVTRHGAYELVPCAGDAPDSLHNGIRNQMTRLEAQLAADGADLVVFDGPLRGRADAKGVGFVKTHHVGYLPDGEQRVLTALKAGQRTPLFLIGGAGVTRWSWYLRLPGPVIHPLSGVVRCELPGTGTVDEARVRADEISTALPRFASEPHKEARAPQNLYPIAGLEADLRRRLGDREILERALRLAAH